MLSTVALHNSCYLTNLFKSNTGLLIVNHFILIGIVSVANFQHVFAKVDVGRVINAPLRDATKTCVFKEFAGIFTQGHCRKYFMPLKSVRSAIFPEVYLIGGELYRELHSCEKILLCTSGLFRICLQIGKLDLVATLIRISPKTIV